MKTHFIHLTLGLIMSACVASIADAQANFLVLDSNGNYVDGGYVKTDERPYAAPGITVELAEEGQPFFDPNARVAIDSNDTKHPSGLYEAILEESNILKSEAVASSIAPSFLTVGSEVTEDSTSVQLPTVVGDKGFETAPTGDLVFATVVKTEATHDTETTSEDTYQTVTVPVVLKTMPSLNNIKEEMPVSIENKTDQTLYDAIIYAEIAKHENVDAAFVKAVISAESNYNATAVSPKGAMGLMQIMPDTAKRYDVVNPFSPEQNIRAGTAELSRLMTLYRNPSLALAAYNAGEGAVEKYDGVPPFSETQEYIVRVLTKTFNARERHLTQTRTESATIVKQEPPEKEDNPLLRPLVVQTFDY